ncbi:invasion associated locus B family protein [Roseomonas populi]|uniref:Invasion associated locus B family protein n=1 Tax=Roseomonas populi TaxID=3121582 RepID=A0ABT1WZC6_9PROT|nr:invasion associated locus B family protein [Roseomonas pecuniae]MCR0981200.1 invasion associated locus B family protein [Roseomonas pecuniae]
MSFGEEAGTRRFVEGEERGQETLLPGCIEDDVSEENPQEGSTVPQPDRTSATYDNWTLNCGRSGGIERRCEVSQTLVNPQGQPLVQLVARRDAAAGSVTFSAQVGVNVTVSEAARLTPEGQPGLTLPFARCLPRGCFAEVALPEAALPGLARAAETARLEFRNAEGGAVAFAVSLRGLATALDALQSAERS